MSIKTIAKPMINQLMTVSQKTIPADARINNRMLIFNYLFPKQILSRAMLVRKTKLSKASISTVVYEMLEDHILVESGQESKIERGKKGTLLEVDANYWNIITIDLSQPCLIQGAVVNLCGDILKRSEISLYKSTDANCEKIIEVCKTLINNSNNHILGIGIAVPGIVDDEGRAVRSSNLQWENINIKEELIKHFNCPIIVDHDTNSALLAERFFGNGVPNTIFIQLSLGVGASILINDAIITGINNSAGEIGHITVDPQGPDCSCGKKGCLETYISAETLHRKMFTSNRKPEDILAEAGNYLGKALTTTINLLDLTDVVIYGPSDIVNKVFISSTEKAIQEYGPYSPKHPCTVRRCTCNNDITLIGECISVIQNRIMNL
ncbi:ROK family protein [Gardnerella vaginalis]|uniref:ROK family protein n=1 Tax=Gardnerella vaginalis TaxID=2702 RepID=UPI00200DDE94|nr:ROK family protein [Gardnerella vaginalis]UQA85287.1 ROK family protein [Gardnerella vaginalis]UQA89776.1 ROK family protein [Gardnerella vaginalis]